MKEDNGRDKLLCFLLLDTIPSISPKIASGNARNHPPERFPSRHSNSADISHQRGGLPLFQCFPPTFHYPRHTNLFQVPGPPFPRAFPPSINAWNPKRVAVSPPVLLPSGFIPDRQDTAMGISETVSASTVCREFKLDDSCSGEGINDISPSTSILHGSSNSLTECIISEYRIRYIRRGGRNKIEKKIIV